MNELPEVKVAKLRQMLDMSPVYLTTGILLGIVLSYSLLGAFPHTQIALWFSTIVIISIIRAILHRKLLASELQTADTIYHSLLLFRSGVLISAMAWGAAGIIFFPDSELLLLTVLMLILTGLSIGSIISYAADYVSAALFSISALMPVTLLLLVHKESMHSTLGSVLILYMTFLLVYLKYMNRKISENILLRLNAVANEEKIKLSEERYRLLLYHSPVGIFHFDRSLVITYCNEIIVSTLKSSTDIIVGLDMNKLKDQALAVSAREAIEGRLGHYEGYYQATFTNVGLWIAMICAPSRNSKGDIVGGIGIVQDITDRKQAADEIRNLAYFDPLTNLPNRRSLLDWLSQSISSSDRTGKSGALLFVDLDNFKTINDTFGHEAGDHLLKEIARRLKSCVRENDTVARLSGDEFVIILELLSEDLLEAAKQTELISEKLRASINMPIQLNSHFHKTTPSIGATIFRGNGQKVDEILRQADIAMYEAKKSGRNAFRFFDPAMQEALNKRAKLESALGKALDNNELLLYYQVQVDDKGTPLGAEVLLRWLNQERGLVSPADFIPLAEESGMIIHIGKWILEMACNQLHEWQKNENTRHLTLAVNISARQFRQQDFIDQLKLAINKRIINPRLLKLELTESVVLDNIDLIIEKMNALKEIGIRFSLDDFGTGYSSLQYLKRLPLDQLKIDQSFIRDVVDNHNDRAIVSTIIAMAQSLDLEVIAEGVETEAQRQFLLERHCNHYQGFLFGKPQPIEAFELLVNTKQ